MEFVRHKSGDRTYTFHWNIWENRIGPMAKHEREMPVLQVAVQSGNVVVDIAPEEEVGGSVINARSREPVDV